MRTLILPKVEFRNFSEDTRDSVHTQSHTLMAQHLSHDIEILSLTRFLTVGSMDWVCHFELVNAI